MVATVGGEIVGRAEDHQRDIAFGAELLEAIAHGGRMVGTRQSMRVTMKDQELRSAALIRETPGPAGRVDEFDRRCWIADAGTGERHEAGV